MPRWIALVVLLIVATPSFAATEGGAIPVPLPLFPAMELHEVERVVRAVNEIVRGPGA